MDLNIIIPSVISGVVAALTAVLTFIATNKSTEQKKSEAKENQLVALENRLTQKLTEHKTEYIGEINKVKTSISALETSVSEMQAGYQTTVATVTLQIANLEKKQDKHNDVITRTFLLEKDVEVLKNREKVSENRLKDLEDNEKAKAKA